MAESGQDKFLTDTVGEGAGASTQPPGCWETER